MVFDDGAPTSIRDATRCVAHVSNGTRTVIDLEGSRLQLSPGHLPRERCRCPQVDRTIGLTIVTEPSMPCDSLGERPAEGTSAEFVLKNGHVTYQQHSVQGKQLHGCCWRLQGQVHMENVVIEGPADGLVLLCCGSSCDVRLTDVTLVNTTLLLMDAAAATATRCHFLGGPAAVMAHGRLARCQLVDTFVLRTTAAAVWATGSARASTVSCHIAPLSGTAVNVSDGAELAAHRCVMDLTNAPDASAVRVTLGAQAQLRLCALQAGLHAVAVSDAGSCATLAACSAASCGGHGIRAERAGRIALAFCTVQMCFGSGVFASDAGTGVQVRGCVVDGHVDNAFVATGGAHVVLDACQLSMSQKGFGLHVRDEGTQAQLQACRLSHNEAANAWVEFGARASLRDCELLASAGDGLVAADPGTAAFVTRCIALGNAGVGLLATSGSNITVKAYNDSLEVLDANGGGDYLWREGGKVTVQPLDPEPAAQGEGPASRRGAAGSKPLVVVDAGLEEVSEVLLPVHAGLEAWSAMVALLEADLAGGGEGAGGGRGMEGLVHVGVRPSHTRGGEESMRAGVAMVFEPLTAEDAGADKEALEPTISRFDSAATVSLGHWEVLELGPLYGQPMSVTPRSSTSEGQENIPDDAVAVSSAPVSKLPSETAPGCTGAGASTTTQDDGARRKVATAPSAQPKSPLAPQSNVAQGLGPAQPSGLGAGAKPGPRKTSGGGVSAVGKPPTSKGVQQKVPEGSARRERQKSDDGKLATASGGSGRWTAGAAAGAGGGGGLSSKIPKPRKARTLVGNAVVRKAHSRVSREH